MADWLGFKRDCNSAKPLSPNKLLPMDGWETTAVYKLMNVSSGLPANGCCAASGLFSASILLASPMLKCSFCTAPCASRSSHDSMSCLSMFGRRCGRVWAAVLAVVAAAPPCLLSSEVITRAERTILSPITTTVTVAPVTISDGVEPALGGFLVGFRPI